MKITIQNKNSNPRNTLDYETLKTIFDNPNSAIKLLISPLLLQCSFLYDSMLMTLNDLKKNNKLIVDNKPSDEIMAYMSLLEDYIYVVQEVVKIATTFKNNQ